MDQSHAIIDKNTSTVTNKKVIQMMSKSKKLRFMNRAARWLYQNRADLLQGYCIALWRSKSDTFPFKEIVEGSFDFWKCVFKDIHSSENGLFNLIRFGYVWYVKHVYMPVHYTPINKCIYSICMIGKRRKQRFINNATKWLRTNKRPLLQGHRRRLWVCNSNNYPFEEFQDAGLDFWTLVFENIQSSEDAKFVLDNDLVGDLLVWGVTHVYNTV